MMVIALTERFWLDMTATAVAPLPPPLIVTTGTVK